MLLFQLFLSITMVRAEAFTAKGLVKDFRWNRPVEGLTVLCYDSDPFGRTEFMGSSITDSYGSFSIPLDSSAGDYIGQPDVFCTVDGPAISPEIYTELKYPDEKSIIDFGTVYVHMTQEFPNCQTNGCGPVVRGYDLDWLVPDLWFTEACHTHDCCMMDCNRGNHTVMHPSFCNEEFYDLLYARCRAGAWPAFCHTIAKIYEYAVNRYDTWEHWCLIQSDYCGPVDHEKCKT